ncbi:PIR protein [Plasmodium vivax]|uniref:VIR protein n=1 Tax=Plasmodium vivax TaxID=5855 RepID=A0A565A4K9_PLAVI|nr:PIR protein [Plasmodium vivax]
MEKKLTKNDFDKFTSNVWYSNFDRGEGGCEEDPFISEIKDELEGPRYRYYDLSKISDNIVRALCYIYNRKINHQNDFDKDRCSYFYYWLGDKIYSRLHDKTKFSSIIKMIYDEIYTTDLLNTCPYLYKDIDVDTFNTYKILHDYSKDYKNIHLKTLSGDITCDEEYKKAIYKYIDAYNDVYSNCKIELTKKYDCVYFDSLFGSKPHQDLSSYTCKNAQNQILAPSSNGELLHEEYTLTKIDDSYRNTGQRDHSNIYLNPVPETKRVLDTGSTVLTENTPDDSSSKTIMGSVVPVLGVSSFSLLLYKVTPVGGFINRFLGRNRNMYNHIEYVDAFNPYSERMDPVDRRMNISYHRL